MAGGAMGQCGSQIVDDVAWGSHRGEANPIGQDASHRRPIDQSGGQTTGDIGVIGDETPGPRGRAGQIERRMDQPPGAHPTRESRDRRCGSIDDARRDHPRGQ